MTRTLVFRGLQNEVHFVNLVETYARHTFLLQSFCNKKHLPLTFTEYRLCVYSMEKSGVKVKTE